MNRSEQYVKIIEAYEAEPGFVCFDDLNHLAQNIACRTGDDLSEVTSWVYGYFSSAIDNVTRAASALGSIRTERKERPEFPSYVGWDGSEHGEF